MNLLLFVMAGLVPAIHENKGVDARDKPGHDEEEQVQAASCTRAPGAGQ